MVNLGKSLRKYLDIVIFPVLDLFFRPSLAIFKELPPIKNYIFGIRMNKAGSSLSFGLIFSSN